MKEKFRQFLQIFGALALILVISVAFAAKSSHAQNFFGNLFKNLFSSSSTSNTVGQAPLYKPVADYEEAVIQAVKKASPAVVSITISKNVPVLENCAGSPFSNLPPEFRQFFDMPQFTVPCDTGQTQLQEVGGGSGFIVSSDGLILTNKHVVSDTAASYTVFTNDGKKYDAKVLARDPAQDLAVVKINATGLPTVSLGDSSNLELGQTAIAIGNALAEFRNTVSVGAVSGLARNITASNPGGGGSESLQGLIQTDAAINPGNSGGPLLNLAGDVIGIDTAVAQGAQNIGFAIPINLAKRDIDSVKATGEIQSPYIGVRYVMITPDLASSKKLAVDHGALVQGSSGSPAIVPGSPAAQAGLKSGDIITSLNGKDLTKDYPLSQAVAEHKVGDKVTLTVIRAGKTISVDVVLGKRT
jgi:serine protease Do